MPRQRNRGREQLPKYVYPTKGYYVYREYQGVEHGRARFAPDRRLCPDDTPIEELWRIFREETAGTRQNTLGWLFDKFIKSAHFRELADSTQAMYKRNARTIESASIKGGRKFGEIPIKGLTPGVFRKYMDRRSEDAYVQANRELSFIKSAFAWAYERDMVTGNPAAKVKKNKETPRDKYVEDAEYLFVRDRATPPIYAAMELAYLCRARINEVLKFDRAMIRDEGLLLERSKGSKTQLIGWTPRLREAIRQGRVGRDGNTKLSRYIISRNDGSQMQYAGFKSAWARLKAKCKKDGMTVDFTYHDLKAKGVSDFDGDKHKASGHKSPRMTAIYDRKRETIKATK
ncbi:MAG: hypothetical protein PF501_18895 [Salinisphaera sp.]|jgi:site-specific recombinase XerD|nr:hypothetical protein [Salinisphaera sp.]